MLLNNISLHVFQMSDGSSTSVTLFTPQVVLTQLPGQELHVEVLDKDVDMKDDFMGRYCNYQ